MNDKICPMYKAALLSENFHVHIIGNSEEYKKLIQCDGPECMWWELVTDEDAKQWKRSHCGRVNG